MWSAVNTPMIASPSRRASSVAASPTALAVSRGQGSASRFEGGNSGSSSATAGMYCPEVITQICSGASSPASRSYDQRSSERPSKSRSICLGRLCRDNGQSRVPDPPAMMTA